MTCQLFLMIYQMRFRSKRAQTEGFPPPQMCIRDSPSHSVYDLPYLGKKAAALREMGVISIHDIPDALEFNPNQSKHIRAVKLGEPLIEKRAIKQRLDGLDHPLYFLDYETVNPAIPLFPGYQPYEHIIFQYVLYVLEKPGAVPLPVSYTHLDVYKRQL